MTDSEVVNSYVYAVVGVGSIGQRHAHNLRQLRPQARIVAVSESLSQRGGLPAFPVFDVLYESLDQAIKHEDLCAVILCNAAPLHIPGLVACINGNLPVFVEKPLAHVLPPQALVQSLQSDGDPFIQVGYNLRYTHGLQKIKQVLDAGTLGRVTWAHAEVGQYLPDWRPNADYRRSVTARRDQGGGVLLELSHELNYLQYLFGNPIAVQAQLLETGLLDIDVEDQADLLCTYENSQLVGELAAFTAQVHLDCLQRQPHRRLRLVGSLGTLEWDVIASTVTVFLADSGAEDLQPLQWSFPEDTGNWVYLSELESFLSRVECRQCDAGNNEGITTSFAQGAQTLAVIAAARLASASGQRQVLDWSETNLYPVKGSSK